MQYELLDVKWGDARYGTPGGIVSWSASFSDEFKFDSRYDQEDFIAAVGESFDAWEAVADIDFVEVPFDADIRVFDSNLGDEDYIGQASWTQVQRDGADRYANVRIEFDNTELWALDAKVEGFDFRTVALHEIGHTIGLDHVGDQDEIMFATIDANGSAGTKTLGDGDTLGAQAIYGAAAGASIPGGGSDIDRPQPPRTAESDSGGGGGLGGGVIAIVAGLIGALFGIFGGGGGGGSTTSTAAMSKPAPEAEPEAATEPVALGPILEVFEPEADAFLL